MSDSIPSVSIPFPLDHLSCQAKTQLALEMLVSAVLLNEHVPTHLNRLAYLKEYATVRMTTARGLGHTSGLSAVVKKYFKAPMFLAETVMMTKVFEYLGHEKSSCFLIRFLDSARGYNWDCIAVDVTSIIAPTRIEKLYEFAASLPKLRCIIMVG